MIGRFLGIAAALLLMGSTVHAACPSIGEVQGHVSKVFRQGVTVTNIKESEVPGLCDVYLEFKGRNRMAYTDSKGEYLIAGQIFRTRDKVNITKEAMDELNRFTADDLKKLDALVAFTAGSGKKSVYLITDPQCPYCKKAEKILDEMIEKGEITVKYLMFPLPFHKGAKEECIAIICDDKGLEGFRSGYKSENQCEAGKKKVEETINFLREKGISGTPTYVFEDGRFHSGVLQMEALEERIGIKAGK